MGGAASTSAARVAGVGRRRRGHPLPCPGVLHGNCPSRPESHGPRWPAALAVGWHRLLTACSALPDRRFVAQVLATATLLEPLDDGALLARVAPLRARLAADGLGGEALAQAFSLVHEMARRVLGLRSHASQLVAARAMLRGRLAEMATGEGKTLAAFLAALVAALAGVPVHLVTANDYLVQRDADRLRPLAERLGLRVGRVLQPDAPAMRAAAYGCDITYCTARELAFDHLRDRLASEAAGRAATPLQQRAAACAGQESGLLMRGLCCALIDEADSILLDEATTPLVLSQAQVDEAELARCRIGWRVSGLLGARHDYRLLAAERCAELTLRGHAAAVAHLQRLGVAPRQQRCTLDAVVLALAARHLYLRDHHYLVRQIDGETVLQLIDDTTGRVAEGRVWSQGLHTLVELKEGCTPTGAPVTLAHTSFQRFFPRYLLLGGMSGTLQESRAELGRLYGLPVQRIAPRRRSRRQCRPTRLYLHGAERWAAVVAEAARLHALGLPVLLATDSVADSEQVACRLQAAGLPHQVLNARHDAAEAAIVARAGQPGAITVATNMAGRGTDIAVPPAVEAAGGLQVLACQHNAARRLDRQLAGRCGRQGQQGAVQRWLALDGGLFANCPRSSAALRALLRPLLAIGGRPALVGWLADALAWLPQQAAERRAAACRQALRKEVEAWRQQLSFVDD